MTRKKCDVHSLSIVLLESIHKVIITMDDPRMRIMLRIHSFIVVELLLPCLQTVRREMMMMIGVRELS